MDYKCFLFVLCGVVHVVVPASERLVLQTSDGSLSQSSLPASLNATSAEKVPPVLHEDSYIDFEPVEESTGNEGPYTCTDCVCGLGRKTRIVGGNTTDIFEFPWLISMTKQGQYHCGGSLITRNYVLTAAHCLFGFNKRWFEITLARNNLPNKKKFIVRRRIKSMTLHENYNPRNYNNDIALIELDKPIPLNGVIRTACLPRKAADYTGAIATVVGWGRTAEDHPISDDLQMVNLPVMSKDECNNSGYEKNRITENMFCAGYIEGTKDSCFGDSGGPLHVKGKHDQLDLVGLISWGRGCSRPNFPGVYTKLTNYLGWLKNKLKDECVCPSSQLRLNQRQ